MTRFSDGGVVKHLRNNPNDTIQPCWLMIDDILATLNAYDYAWYFVFAIKTLVDYW